MIIPWLRGFIDWRKAPLTWTLIFTNLMIFLMTYDPRPIDTNYFSDTDEIVLTGRLYQQYQSEKKENKTREDWILAGSRALRDPEFVKAAPDLKFEGDTIAIAEWKKNIEKFESHFQKKNSYLFGLLTDGNRPLTWITYQFMHAGWIHLFSNMMLLMIFGVALESIGGGLILLVTYLLGGIAGGAGFYLLSPQTIAPMIGASGSLSAVMAAYAVMERKKRVAYFYFLSPIQGYYGVIYLPTLLIFPLCFVADVANYLATPMELGSGVAYTAHIGGMIFGVAIGALLRILPQPARTVSS